MNQRILLAASAASLLLLAACSSEEAFTPRSGTQTYDSAQAIAEDLGAGGMPCDSINPTTAGSKFASDTVYCVVGQDGYLMSIHLSELDQIGQQVAAEQSTKPEWGLLQGANWSINCDNPNTCSEMKQILGGKVTSSANQ